MASSVAVDKTAEASLALDLERFSWISSFPEPTLAIAELAPRLGMKRSAAYDMVVLLTFDFSPTFLDLELEGVLAW